MDPEAARFIARRSHDPTLPRATNGHRLTPQLGIIAVAISAFRIVTIRTATAIGGRASGLRRDHRSLVWMGLVSQAGVTLGLAVIVANQYPGWGNALQTLVVSMIAIHEVIGPVLLRAALVRAGEIGRMDE